MQISISNSIGSSSNSGGPLPTTERYFVSDCVGYYGDFNSANYPIGTFQVGDRVEIAGNEYASFGLIDSITTNISDEILIYSTGINTDVCFDNFVVLSSYNGIDDTSVDFAIEINSTEDDFISNNEYAMTVNYINSILVLVYVTDEEGGGNYYDEIDIGFSGSPTFNTYFYEIEGSYEIISRSYSFPSNQTPIEYYNQEIFIVPSFQNTNGYNDNEGCPNYAFLRNSGSQVGLTFNMSYRNDNC